jgi:hypothetical protein
MPHGRPAKPLPLLSPFLAFTYAFSPYRHQTPLIYGVLVQVWGLAEDCFAEPEYLVYQPYVGLHVVYHARRILYRGRSRYQKIDIIENEAYGIMLFLNNNLQHAELEVVSK